METVPADILAQMFECSTRYVCALAQTRIIPPQVAPGQYDLAGCVRGYLAYLKRRRETSALAAERIRLVVAQADHAQVRLDRLRRESYPADQVDHAWRAER